MNFLMFKFSCLPMLHGYVYQGHMELFMPYSLVSITSCISLVVMLCVPLSWRGLVELNNVLRL